MNWTSLDTALGKWMWLVEAEDRFWVWLIRRKMVSLHWFFSKLWVSRNISYFQCKTVTWMMLNSNKDGGGKKGGLTFMPQQPVICVRLVQVLCLHCSPLLSELPLCANRHQKVLSHSTKKVSRWLSSLSAVSLWKAPLCTRTAVIASQLPVCGSKEINGGESASPSLLCRCCRDVGGGRDGPDVNQRVFSSTPRKRVQTLSALAISDLQSLNNESLWSSERP